MAEAVRVVPIACPFHRFHTNAYFVDAPQPALIDTGIATSPSECIAPALANVGLSLRDVSWVLLTHGHPDHVGGAYGVWEETDRQAEVAIHGEDAFLLRKRRAHIRRGSTDTHGTERQEAVLMEIIGGEMEPTAELVGGEHLDLGGGLSIQVHHTPGHSPGSVTFLLDGPNWAFVGDAVQMYGGVINRFPSYEEPSAYRGSLRFLEDMRPERLYMGHRFVDREGVAAPPQVDDSDVPAAIRASLEMESRLADAVAKHLVDVHDDEGPYGPFAAVAREIGYTGDPQWPSPFFITMEGYQRELSE